MGHAEASHTGGTRSHPTFDSQPIPTHSVDALNHSSHSNPDRIGATTALLKAHGSLVAEYVLREAAQIFGGLAYTRGGQGGKVERLYREVRFFAIPAGSEEVMLGGFGCGAVGRVECSLSRLIVAPVVWYPQILASGTRSRRPRPWAPSSAVPSEGAPLGSRDRARHLRGSSAID